MQIIIDEKEKNSTLINMKGITNSAFQNLKDPKEIFYMEFGSWTQGLMIGLDSNPINVPMPKAIDLFIDKNKIEK